MSAYAPEAIGTEVFRAQRGSHSRTNVVSLRMIQGDLSTSAEVEAIAVEDETIAVVVEATSAEVETVTVEPHMGIFDLLRTILPNYDLEAVADRTLASYRLAELRRLADERIAVHGIAPDSEADGVEHSEIAEALAEAQFESMANRDDISS